MLNDKNTPRRVYFEMHMIDAQTGEKKASTRLIPSIDVNALRGLYLRADSGTWLAHHTVDALLAIAAKAAGDFAGQQLRAEIRKYPLDDPKREDDGIDI